MYKAEFNVASCLLDPLETGSKRERSQGNNVDELQQNSPCFILNYAAKLEGSSDFYNAPIGIPLLLPTYDRFNIDQA